MARNSPGGHNKVSYTRSFPSLVQGKVAMIPTCLIPPEAFPLLQEIVLRRCEIEPGGFHSLQQCNEYALNGASMDQMTYESYDINRTSGSDTDRLVWPLHESRALCVGHGCRMPRVEHCRMNETCRKTFLWKSTLNLQDVTPSMRILHSARTTETKWKKHEQKHTKTDWFRLDMQEFHVWLRATSSAHSWSRAPKFSHLCGLGPRLLKMLLLTALDSPTIFFWLVQVLHRLIAICQSASWLLGIKEPTFRYIANCPSNVRWRRLRTVARQ